MNKLLFSLAITLSSFSFGQITLEKSFSDGEKVFVYSTPDDTFYLSQLPGNVIKIYNSNLSINKTIKAPIPENSELDFNFSMLVLNYGFNITKYVFNDDDKLEFIASCSYKDKSSNEYRSKLIVFNEDGELIKEFLPNPKTNIYYLEYEIFNDKKDGKNKMFIYNRNVRTTDQTDIYSLQTTQKAIEEIQSKSKPYTYPF